MCSNAGVCARAASISNAQQRVCALELRDLRRELVDERLQLVALAANGALLVVERLLLLRERRRGRLCRLGRRLCIFHLLLPLQQTTTTLHSALTTL